ncbi:TetR/AcrR family transcriptional regulator [Cellulomonas sp. S1-8]|uniref:TetR/AcrR family transcriptional regulator n=1 Tax=Cellulomonas sp. S1-8 TaxID=2904790 RepID=UPI002243BC6E|nr:TetR/AcrR family transcriptional regulator [Cellulomonas sp. S1-8]UZN03285.1 TetR family transcriptional regulator [Cellulomonas sp. S1-8]
MPARTADPAATKAAILAVARRQFGQLGIDRTTIRSVAGGAGVDPALVMHYFGSKDGLFRAASRVDLEMPDLTGLAPEEVAGVVVPLFVQMWGPDGPLLPLLRAAASDPSAAAALAEIFAHRVAPRLAALAVDSPEERAALIGAHLVGVAVARHIIGVPSLAQMDDATLAAWLGPVFAHYLTAVRPAAPGGP